MPAALESGAAARYNFRMGVLNGLFFMWAETLMDPTLVLVAFVSRLTASPLLLGLVVPLRDASWFLPQLWLSGHLPTQPRKLPLYNRMSFVRSAALLAMAAAVFSLRDKHWLLVAFFAALAVYSLAGGISGLPFLEVVGKTVAPGQRGLFFAWRLTLGGLASIGASLVVRWLLDDLGPLPFPQNFGVLFSLGLVLVAGGLWAFSRVREPEDVPAPQSISVGQQLRRAGTFFRSDSNLRHFLFLRTALIAAGSATPFFAIFVQRELGGALSMIGVYLATGTLASLAANLAFGRASQVFGNRRILQAASLFTALLTASAVALVALARPLGLSGQAASLWLIPVFALWGIRESGIGVSGQSLLLDIAPLLERSLYLGFANTWLGIALLATSVSGLIVANLGFLALMGLAFTASLLAVNSAFRLREVAPLPALPQSLPEIRPAP